MIYYIQNHIVQLGRAVDAKEGDSLEEQIVADEQRAKLQKEIARLEKQARAENNQKRNLSWFNK